MKLRIGASAAIIKDKKILLVKRASSQINFPDCWAFPAGGLEDSDKTIQAAVIREVKEEVNLDFQPEEHFKFYESQPNDYRVITLVFLGTWSGDVKIQESELSDFGWFSFDEAMKLELGFAYKDVIRDLNERGLL